MSSKIGFSTGCLYKSGLSIDQIVSVYGVLNVNSVEISFATPKNLFDFKITDRLLRSLTKYSSISIHAPWKQIVYSSSLETQRVFDKLKFISDFLHPDSFVLHPDVVTNFDVVEQSRLSFVIENMDCRKKYGVKPEHFLDLKKNHPFDFVFDTQHAYEHDSSMKLANELILVMGDRLHHIHLSGESSNNNHIPVHLSRNKSVIEKILPNIIHNSIVLEGLLPASYTCVGRKEVDFVNQFRTNYQ